jgi:DNA-binding transcriptional LysR family regulator
MDDLDWRVIAELNATPNITRTAERLNMTQSALSKRLQQIEADLHAQIVIRYSKGIVFTPEGEHLAAKAREILSQFDDIRHSLLQVGNGKSGTLRIGATDGFARSTLLPFLKDYKHLFPRVEIDLRTDISANLIAMLRDFQIHVAFICGETEFDFQRVLISVDQARLVNRDPIRLEDLPNLSQIAYLRDPFSAKLLADWWRDRFTIPPKIGIHANHGDACREMVMAGLGYAVFLSNVFLPAGSGLFEMPIYYSNRAPLLRNSWMVWQKDFSQTPLVSNFVNSVKAKLASSRGTAKAPGYAKPLK